MMSFKKEEWFSNIRSDVLAGLVVGLALIPESIAFSAIAGVDPQVGLYASFCIAVTIAFFGGRPAMISAATGAMALLMITLVKVHGLQYLLAATILTGILQLIAGYFKIARWMRFVSQPVIYGFLNALAILIFMAQLPEFQQMNLSGFVLVTLGLAVIYLFPYVPKLGKVLPSPLICILVLTALTAFLDTDMRMVSDLGHFPDTLPMFLVPEIPLTFETLHIIFPYAITLATVGLLESMMTTTVVNELTNSEADRDKECRGQGLANIISGFMGGMAGCAMIGQSVINARSGARTRLSTLVAGVFLLCLVVFFKDSLAFIPMPALVAVMVMVAFTTFQWDSIKNLSHYSLQNHGVMFCVMVIVLMTHNLALGVLAGILLSVFFFIAQVERTVNVHSERWGQQRQYRIHGHLLFSNVEYLSTFFDFKEQIEQVEIELSDAHIWDATAVHQLNAIVEKFEAQGICVKVEGLSLTQRVSA